ncbi:SLC13 family permease [Nitrincola sp.]|uniref:SLC13 family permease n=1 Tax=Nitrincola sp. TaxID=1926584 RepID=UPI003A8FF0D3
MTPEMLFVFGLLAATVVLFIIDKLRMDVVALLVVVVLAASGIITPTEAVSGFGNSVVIMIAGLFVVGEGLFRTGIAAAAGNWLLRVGGSSEVRLLLFLLPVVALLSAFMSSTGAVALLIPVVLSMARKSGMQPSRLLMPLAFAALIGGMLTLIGTPPNIIVSGQMRETGEPFGFFDFTPIGLVMLIVGCLYLVFIGRFLLPKSEARDPEDSHPTLSEFAERYGIRDQLHKLLIQPDSPLAGKTLAEMGLRTEYETTVFAIQRRGSLASSIMPVLANTRMQHLDTLMVYGAESAVEQLCQALQLRRQGFPERDIMKVQQQFGFAEVLLPPNSSLINQSLKEGHFRERFNLSVIGVRRHREPLTTEFGVTRMEAGDTLLLTGSWEHIRKLENRRDLVVIETPAEMHEIAANASKAPIALGIMLAMLVSMTFGLLPNLTAVLLAALAMILTGCMNMNEAYQSLNAKSLVLIAGMLPLALAMETSGALSYVVSNLVENFGDTSPLLLCAGLFILTSSLSQFISNTATTVLVAPIALTTSQLLGLNPEPFMMTVAIAASTAFATPIASPVNTLVLAPGNYRFVDFAKVGIPLQILAMIVTLVMTPLLFPFQ